MEDEGFFFFFTDLLGILIGIQGILSSSLSFYLSIANFLTIYFILGSRAMKWNLSDCIIDFFFFCFFAYIGLLGDTLLEVLGFLLIFFIFFILFFYFDTMTSRWLFISKIHLK